MPIDYKKYPSNWKTEIRPRIQKRAGNCCEFCGLENYADVFSLKLKLHNNADGSYRAFWVSSMSEVKRMLPLAHKQEYKRVRVICTVAHLDHDATNEQVSDDRLAFLCQHCHGTYDAGIRAERRLNTLHLKRIA